MKLDHFFILTEPGAAQAELLIREGFIEGPANTHPGQGTANRRFFFDNTTLEFLFVSDPAEAQSGPGRDMQLVARASQARASLFGIIVDAGRAGHQNTFPGWAYFPEYFSGKSSFWIGENANKLNEPLCIIKPEGLQPGHIDPSSRNSGQRLTKLHISVPVSQASIPLESITDCPELTLELNQAHAMLVEFNHGENGKSLSLAPQLPVTIYW